MKTSRIWSGVRMRTVLAGADPDAPARAVTLPTSWEDAAACALAALAPGNHAIELARAAEAWIRPIADRAGRAGLGIPLAERLHALLLLRRGAPDASVWQARPDESPAFVLNLAAFHDPANGFDAAAFAEAAGTAVTALILAASGAPRIAVRMADLAGLLAALGIGYDSEPGRGTARRIAGTLRDQAEALSGALAASLGAAVPHMATAIGLPGPAEALLGVETGGIAPPFSATKQGGSLTRTSRAWLAAKSLSAEAALAAFLDGENPLPLAGPAAHVAMHEAVAPFVHVMPARPPLAPASVSLATAPRRRQLPPRPAGYRKTAGGHKLDGLRDWAPLLPLDLPAAVSPRARRRGLGIAAK